MLSVIDRFIPRHGAEAPASRSAFVRAVTPAASPSWRYQRTFPDFGELDVPVPAGFVDSSCVDDGMPSFTNELLRLLLMIDYADPAQRLGSEAPRFAVFDVDELKRLSASAFLFESDNYDEVVRFIDQLR